MRGRPKAELMLSESEREQLQAWSRRRKTAQALALRSRIVLNCASGTSNKVVAGTLGGHAADSNEMACALSQAAT
jgi:hypothetical protein